MDRPTRKRTHLVQKLEQKTARAGGKPGKRAKRWKKWADTYAPLAAPPPAEA